MEIIVAFSFDEDGEGSKSESEGTTGLTCPYPAPR